MAFELNIKNIDTSKLDLGLRHDYVPDTTFNEKLDEKDKIVVDCEYLRVGERTSFASLTRDEEVTMDIYRKIFAKKVKGIRNLVINKKPVTTAEELLKYPSVVALEALVLNVATHIMHADELTEDEEKN